MEADPVEGAGEEKAILKQYAGMLEGIRRMPKLLRPLARREALEWRRAALKVLRERRAIERNARQEMRRLKIRWHDARELRPPGRS